MYGFENDIWCFLGPSDPDPSRGFTFAFHGSDSRKIKQMVLACIMNPCILSCNLVIAKWTCVGVHKASFLKLLLSYQLLSPGCQSWFASSLRRTGAEGSHGSENKTDGTIREIQGFKELKVLMIRFFLILFGAVSNLQGWYYVGSHEQNADWNTPCTWIIYAFWMILACGTCRCGLWI